MQLKKIKITMLNYTNKKYNDSLDTNESISCVQNIMHSN